ncbi:DEAD/DEAH box helicase, partial [Candidatus Roizmanbacteria bacterium]|nr:DEAD/DEAH box helicase [Candidatus Roizmanbacteria bacterium]
QHFNTVSELVKSLKIRVALQTSAFKTKSLDKYNVIIGTHALINEKLNFEKVGFVIIDEQHRFGVQQRAILKDKGINPHLLTMTATPIPRTVALTLYGELDISHLDEMPKGRIPVKTYVVPKNKRDNMYKWLEAKIIKEKIQIFVVCPLIEESEKETMQSIKAAKIEYDFLSKKVFPKFKVGLLHGKMKSKEKDEVMKKFKENNCSILVCTSVVEVGIDISNATVMVVEAAERYGLAQLHQLRGRIGRGEKQSFCLLFCETTGSKALKRLKFFAQNTSGAKIAAFDLQQRGPGEIYGTSQHGVFQLKIADLTNYELLEKTKKAVFKFDKKYKIGDYPQLKKRLDEYNIHQIARD